MKKTRRLLALVALPLVAASASSGQEKPARPEPPPEFSFSLRDQLTRVLFDEPGDGRVWARGRDYRASFGPEGFTMLPVFGRAARREYPVKFELQDVSVGGLDLAIEAGTPTLEGASVEIRHGALREVYHLGLDRVEQTFVFDSLAGAGDLVVHLDVDTDLALDESHGDIRFTHPSLGHVTYGEAFALDAGGSRISMAREWNGSGITLRVPAEFAASAELPLTIDPMIDAYVVPPPPGTDNATHPDPTFAGQDDRWIITWEDQTSSANSDCYAAVFNLPNVWVDTVAIDMTSDDWRRPSVAYNYHSGVALIAAETWDTSNEVIKGRKLDPSGVPSASGAAFDISLPGGLNPRLSPSVGGNKKDGIPPLVLTPFCVTWSNSDGAQSDVQYRLVYPDCSMDPIQEITSSTTWDDIQTTISESLGDPSGPGADQWTIAWTRAGIGFDRGQIMARRIWSHGDPTPTVSFPVSAMHVFSRPSVTSVLGMPLWADGQRPSIVAYQRLWQVSAGVFASSIHANVVTNGVAYSENSISRIMEDVDGDLDQRNVSIATDGDGFLLTYAEEWWGCTTSNPNCPDFDMFMVSGHISQRCTGAYLALAERHSVMAHSSTPENFGRVATEWDGKPELTPGGAVGLAIWSDGPETSDGTLEGTTWRIGTPLGDPGAVGHQFCDAQPNTVPNTPWISEFVSAWISIVGTQQISDFHDVYCIDLPPATFGMLLTSMQQGSTPVGDGTLCIAGPGRFLASVQSSGSTGTFYFSLDPTMMSTPSGVVSALPCSTWHFQWWFRDTGSSNLSNAASVTFR